MKNEYVLEDAYYSFGWSHGKEKLQGKMDTAKGSYYNNPMYNQPVKDETLMKKYPSFLHPNIWPTSKIVSIVITIQSNRTCARHGTCVYGFGTIDGRNGNLSGEALRSVYTGSYDRTIKKAVNY